MSKIGIQSTICHTHFVCPRRTQGQVHTYAETVYSHVCPGWTEHSVQMCLSWTDKSALAFVCTHCLGQTWSTLSSVCLGQTQEHTIFCLSVLDGQECTHSPVHLGQTDRWWCALVSVQDRQDCMQCADVQNRHSIKQQSDALLSVQDGQIACSVQMSTIGIRSTICLSKTDRSACSPFSYFIIFSILIFSLSRFLDSRFLIPRSPWDR